MKNICQDTPNFQELSRVKEMTKVNNYFIYSILATRTMFFQLHSGVKLRYIKTQVGFISIRVL